MVSFKDLIQCKADEHKFDNEIPEEYECVKIDEIINKDFKIDMFNVYNDKEQDRRKVALAIDIDGKKYRVHTGASRIVEIFDSVIEYNKENEENPMDVTEGTHKITSVSVSKGNMLIFE